MRLVDPEALLQRTGRRALAWADIARQPVPAAAGCEPAVELRAGEEVAAAVRVLELGELPAADLEQRQPVPGEVCVGRVARHQVDVELATLPKLVAVRDQQRIARR